MYTVINVSTYEPTRCGLATFSKHLLTALSKDPEVGEIKVAPIRVGGELAGSYGIPVDTNLKIDKYSPVSWEQVTNKIEQISGYSKKSGNTPVVLLQHEYGLDPDKNGNECKGDNYVQMARHLKGAGIPAFVYAHTVLSNPDSHQKRVLKELAKHSDGIIVMAPSAKRILESGVYDNIDALKVEYIPHGIRMSEPLDRLAIKRKYGLEDIVLFTTLGLRSPGKGIPNYAIPSYADFVKDAFTPSHRKNVVYLIAGICHPEFLKTERGKQYEEETKQALADSGLRWQIIDSIRNADFVKNNIVLLNAYIGEELFLELNSATNGQLLPYENKEQRSSGIIADTIGSGRIVVVTDVDYAKDLLDPADSHPKRPMISQNGIGIMVSSGERCREEMPVALYFLTDAGYKSQRLKMEQNARRVGREMIWENVAQALLEHIDYVMEMKTTPRGRGPEIFLKKDSACGQLLRHSR